ncbi:50S ribosomal protein L22 [Candidatus Woesearchaeota archaeon]|nr:50S ribosomal protein L22 [Candidatus Woesearchaeota archaeon]
MSYAKNDFDEKTMARAKGLGLSISTKNAIEIANFIRGKKVVLAKKILEDVIGKRVAVPYKRFNGDVGHKKGIGPGRYPKKASEQILSVIKSAESNASYKGLEPADLVINKLVINKGPTQWHYGRQRRRQMKRTHVEIVLEEKTSKKKEADGVKDSGAPKSKTLSEPKVKEAPKKEVGVAKPEEEEKAVEKKEKKTEKKEVKKKTKKVDDK